MIANQPQKDQSFQNDENTQPATTILNKVVPMSQVLYQAISNDYLNKLKQELKIIYDTIHQKAIMPKAKEIKSNKSLSEARQLENESATAEFPINSQGGQIEGQLLSQKTVKRIIMSNQVVLGKYQSLFYGLGQEQRTLELFHRLLQCAVCQNEGNSKQQIQHQIIMKVELDSDFNQECQIVAQIQEIDISKQQLKLNLHKINDFAIFNQEFCLNLFLKEPINPKLRIRTPKQIDLKQKPKQNNNNNMLLKKKEFIYDKQNSSQYYDHYTQREQCQKCLRINVSQTKRQALLNLISNNQINQLNNQLKNLGQRQCCMHLSNSQINNRIIQSNKQIIKYYPINIDNFILKTQGNRLLGGGGSCFSKSKVFSAEPVEKKEKKQEEQQLINQSEQQNQKSQINQPSDELDKQKEELFSMQQIENEKNKSMVKPQNQTDKQKKEQYEQQTMNEIEEIKMKPQNQIEQEKNNEVDQKKQQNAANHNHKDDSKDKHQVQPEIKINPQSKPQKENKKEVELQQPQKADNNKEESKIKPQVQPEIKINPQSSPQKDNKKEEVQKQPQKVVNNKEESKGKPIAQPEIKTKPQIQPQKENKKEEKQQQQQKPTNNKEESKSKPVTQPETKLKPQIQPQKKEEQKQQLQKAGNNKQESKDKPVAQPETKIKPQSQPQKEKKEEQQQQIQKSTNNIEESKVKPVAQPETKIIPQSQPQKDKKEEQQQQEIQKATDSKEESKGKSVTQSETKIKPESQPEKEKKKEEEQQQQKAGNDKEESKSKPVAQPEVKINPQNQPEKEKKKEEEQIQQQQKAANNNKEESKGKTQPVDKEKQKEEKKKQQQTDLIMKKKQLLKDMFELKEQQQEDQAEQDEVFQKFNKSYNEYFTTQYVNEKVIETDLRLITEETLYRYREQIVQLEIRHKVIDLINLLINYLLIIKNNDLKQSLQSDIELINTNLQKILQYCKENKDKYPCLDLFQYITILLSINSQRKSLDKSNQSIAFQILQKMIQVAKFGAGFVSIAGAIKNLTEINYQDINNFINEVKQIVSKLVSDSSTADAIVIGNKAIYDYNSSNLAKNMQALYLKKIQYLNEKQVENDAISEIIFYLEEVTSLKNSETILFVYMQINYLMSKEKLKDNLIELSFRLEEEQQLELVTNLANFLQVKEYSDSILDKLTNIANLIAQNHQFRFVKAQMLLYFAEIIKITSNNSQLPADIMNCVVSNYLQEKQKSVKIVYEGNQIMADYIHNQIDKKEILSEISKFKKQMTKHMDDKKQYNDFAKEIQNENDLDKQLAKYYVEMWEKGVKERQKKLQITHKDDTLLEAVNLYVKQQITYQRGFQIDTQERDAVKQIINQFLIPNFAKPTEPDVSGNADNDNADNNQEEQIAVLQTVNTSSCPCKIISILADGGSGKSMLLKKLEVELLNRNSEYTQDKNSDFIPFIIKCNSLDQEKPSLENYLESTKIKREDIERLKKAERNKLIMLDGFDEYTGEYFKVFKELKIYEWVNTVVIVTSRLEKISVADAKIYFSFYDKNGNEGEDENFAIVKLEKMQQSDIQEYLENFKKQIQTDKQANFNQEQYNKFQQIIFNNKQLLELLKLPINLYLTTRMAMDLDLNDKNILNIFQAASDQIEIQELFFQQQFKKQSQIFIEKQQKKISNQNEELIEQIRNCYFEYFQCIAMQMFMQKGSKFNYLSTSRDSIKFEVRDEVSSALQKSEVKIDDLIQNLNNYVDSRVITRIHLTFEGEDTKDVSKQNNTANKAQKKGKDNFLNEFEFRHKSIFEYFTARAMKYDFDLHKEGIFKLDMAKLKKFNVNQRIIMSNQKNASEEQILLKLYKLIQPYLDSQAFKSTYSKQEPSQTNRYIQFLKKSQVFNQNEKSEIDIGSSNLLSALFISKFSFINLIFKKCSFSQSYLPFHTLKLAQFVNCNFENAFIEKNHLENFEISNTKNAMMTSFQKRYDTDDTYSFNQVIFLNNTLVSITKTGYINQFEIKPNGNKKTPVKKLLSCQIANAPLKSIQFIAKKNIFAVTTDKSLFEVDIKTFQRLNSYTFQYAITSFQVNNLKYVVTLANNSIYQGDIQTGFKMFDKNQISAQKSLFINDIIIASQNNQINVYNQQNMTFTQTIEDSHQLTVSCYSPDGKYLVTSPEDNSFKVWNLKNDFELINTNYDHADKISCATFSADGKYLATGSEDKKCRIWNVENEFGFVKSVGKHSSTVTSIAFSADGKYIATSSMDRCQVFNIQKGYEIIQSIQLHKYKINSAAFSTDGKLVATGSEDKTCKIWSIEKKFELVHIIQGHTDRISSVAFSGDGKYLATGSWDKTCKIWNCKKGYELVNTIQGHKDAILAVAFSADNKYIATGSYDKTCKIWNEQQGFKLVTTVQGHNDNITSVAFSSNGKYLATGSEDQTCKVWNMQKAYQLITTLEGHAWQITSVAFSRNSKYLVTGSEDNTCKVWNAESGFQLMNTIGEDSDKIFSITFSRDGRYLATGSQDATCKIWNVEQGFQLINTIKGHSKTITSVAFSADGKLLATGSEDISCKIWNVEKGFEAVNMVQGHDLQVISVAFSSDSKQLATASADRTFKIWNTEKGFEIVNTVKAHNKCITFIAFSADGKYLATCSEDNTCKIWNPKKGFELVSTIEGHKRTITSLAFSPDSKHLVTGALDDTCKIWNSEKGFELAKTIEGKTKKTNFLAFSADGKYLAAGSLDNACRILNVQKGFELENKIQMSYMTAVKFSPDGKYLAIGSYACSIFNVQKGFEKMGKIEVDTITMAFSADSKYLVTGSVDNNWQIWKAEKGFELLNTIQGYSGIGFLKTLAFSLDGKYLATGFVDQTCKIWNVNKGFQLIDKLFGNSNQISSIAFSADGKYFATKQKDNTSKIWDIESGFELVTPIQGQPNQINLDAFQFQKVEQNFNLFELFKNDRLFEQIYEV